MRRFVVVVTAVIGGSAAAQPATELFEEGRRLLGDLKPAEACAKFEASLALDPEAAGTMLNLGLCNQDLDRIATALRWFRKAQVRSAETDNAEYEAAAKEHASALAARVPTIRLALTHPAPGAAVMLDGSRVDAVDFARIEVDAGRHVVELRGATTPPQDITIADGEHRTVTVLVPVLEPEKRVVVIDHGRTRRREAYALGGAGVALLAGTTALALYGKSQYDAAQHPADWNRWQQVVRYGSTSMFVLGGAAIAGAVYLYIKTPRVRRIERLVVAGSGVAVAGSF
jgi:hypothetical protein